MGQRRLSPRGHRRSRGSQVEPGARRRVDDTEQQRAGHEQHHVEEEEGLDALHDLVRYRVAPESSQEHTPGMDDPPDAPAGKSVMVLFFDPTTYSDPWVNDKV